MPVWPSLWPLNKAGIAAGFQYCLIWMQPFPGSSIDWTAAEPDKTAVVSGAVRCNARAAFCCAVQQARVRFALEGLAMTTDARSEMAWLRGRGDHSGKAAPGNFGARLLLVPVVVIVGLATWTMISGPGDAEGQSVAVPVSTGLSGQNTSMFNPAITRTTATEASPVETNTPVEANVPPETAPVDGLKISSQSWRRGGLGSNALVTFTLRNANDYAVRDIEISCAFIRRDGSHLTDRARTIHDTVDMKSRKTFARMHVGYVNINADKAKCSLVTASRI
jgi:hypothetical protein